MPQDTRTVRRLVLSSPAAAVGRAAFLVEDGLRTATLQGSERRLIVVRSIPLGNIDVRDSPAALSLRIERKWAEAARFAVPAESGSAAVAPAVTFRSLEHAFARWLAEMVRGRHPNGWFWRRIIPSRIEILPVAEALAPLACEVVEPPSGAPLRVFDFVEELARLDTLRAIVPLLEDRHVQPLLDLLIPGYTPPRFVAIDAPRSSTIDLWQPYRDMFAQRVLIRAIVDQVAFFVALIGTAAARPWLLGSVKALITEVERRLAAAAFTTKAVSTDTRPDEPGDVVSSANVQPTEAEHESIVGFDEAIAVAAERPALADAAPPAAAHCTLPPDNAPGPSERRTTQERPELTEYAGLFFVLPVLFRTGFSEFMDQRPKLFEQGLLPELLRAVATAAGSKPDDPVVLALGPADTPVSEEVQQAITLWRRIARTYVRREAKMLLTHVVRRPGRILYTRTHIDIFFELDQADLRIRQLGLDVDPGWVPELGKVVAYHYGCVRC